VQSEASQFENKAASSYDKSDEDLEYNKDTNVITQVSNGTKVKILERKDDWCKILWGDGVAYVVSYFVVLEDALLGIDWALRYSYETYKKFSDAGYSFAVRYYTATPEAGVKDALTREEAIDISTAGMDVVTVYQDSNNSVSSFTFERGYEQCSNAIKQATEVGQPKGTPIYFAVDFDVVTESDKAAVSNYFKGVNSAIEEYEAQHLVYSVFWNIII
jgi:uncharacterized protein YgiM (DUF1202 family)